MEPTMTTKTEEYLRDALRLFAIDPPDTTFQCGFLEAIEMVAMEGAGFSYDDPDLVAARNANKMDQSSDMKLTKLKPRLVHSAAPTTI
jgi:hypothetical protein